MLETKHLPMIFSVDENFDNDKFLKLRLKICHNSKSLHNTKFTKEALTEAEYTISNVPILAHIYENDDGELDIGGHDMKIEEDRFDESKRREIFLEQPVGVIPETNNYEVVEEDGISYVYCDGYIWKGYSNYCVDILQNSDRIKLSMEVDFNNYHYSRSEDCYVITNYKYMGITLLGSDNKPAMQNSGATIVNYSESGDKIQPLTVEEMCNEISKVFSVAEKETEKGEDTMDAEMKKSILDELGVTEDELDFKITDEMSEEELRAEIQKYLDNKEPKGSENSLTEPNINKYYSADARTITFLMSDEDKREAIYRALDESFDDEYWIVKTYENYIIAEAWMDGKFYKINFTNTDGVVTIDSEFTEVFGEFVTSEEKSELENLRDNYNTLKSEAEDLRQYKTEAESAARTAAVNEVFERFDNKLSESEDYSKLKENNSEYSAEEIEEKCYAILGRINSTFSVNDPISMGVNRITFSQHDSNTDVERKPYGGLFEVFNKN